MSDEIDKFNLDVLAFGQGAMFIPADGSGVSHIPLDGLYFCDKDGVALLEEITVDGPLSFESLERSHLSVLCNPALITNEPRWFDTSCGPSYPVIGYRDA